MDLPFAGGAEDSGAREVGASLSCTIVMIAELVDCRAGSLLAASASGLVALYHSLVSSFSKAKCELTEQPDHSGLVEVLVLPQSCLPTTTHPASLKERRRPFDGSYGRQADVPLRISGTVEMNVGCLLDAYGHRLSQAKTTSAVGTPLPLRGRTEHSHGAH